MPPVYDLTITKKKMAELAPQSPAGKKTSFWGSAKKTPGTVTAAPAGSRPGRHRRMLSSDLDDGDAWGEDSDDERFLSRVEESMAALALTPVPERAVPAATPVPTTPGPAAPPAAASTPLPTRPAESAAVAPASTTAAAAAPPTPAAPAVSSGRSRPPSMLVRNDRLDKFDALFAAPQLETEALRELAWSGVPAPARATAWQVRSGLCLQWWYWDMWGWLRSASGVCCSGVCIFFFLF